MACREAASVVVPQPPYTRPILTLFFTFCCSTASLSSVASFSRHDTWDSNSLRLKGNSGVTVGSEGTQHPQSCLGRDPSSVWVPTLARSTSHSRLSQGTDFWERSNCHPLPSLILCAQGPGRRPQRPPESHLMTMATETARARAATGARAGTGHDSRAFREAFPLMKQAHCLVTWLLINLVLLRTHRTCQLVLLRGHLG